MVRELTTYQQIEDIRRKLDREKVEEQYWGAFNKLDNEFLIKEAHSTYLRGELLQVQGSRLDTLANKFNLISSYLSPTYDRLREIDLKHTEKRIRNNTKLNMLFHITEDRGIHCSEWI